MKGWQKAMAKSKLIALTPVVFLISGAFLIIYGFMTGADFLTVAFAFLVDYPVGLKEFYVLVGIMRVIMAIGEKKAKNNRAGMIVIGILFAFSSIAGVILCIINDDAVSNVFRVVIAVDFIVMFILSLFYLIYAFKQ